MLTLVEATLRTNFFLDERYALSLRFAPHIFAPGAFKEPYQDFSDLDDTGGSSFTEIESGGTPRNSNSGGGSGSGGVGGGGGGGMQKAGFSSAMNMANTVASGNHYDPLPHGGGNNGSNNSSSANSDELPFGVFFVHGRRFNGFHCRFRDIARGGMRLVTPPDREQLAIESARHFDECYRLAEAQQAKNKDIPEGGSKCVVLIDTMNLKNEVRTLSSMRNLATRRLSIHPSWMAISDDYSDSLR